MPKRFISEPIVPVAGTTPTTGVKHGEPSLPARFTWRDTEYAVDALLEKWKETGGCKSGGGEMYVRKHWFHIRTTTGEEMRIYFERQPRSKSQSKKRWWLYTVTEGE